MLINKSMFPVQAGYNAISNMQGQLGTLQTQLGNGQKSQTLAEMGADRSFSLALRGRLTRLDSYSQNMTTVNLRLSFLDQAFTTLSTLKSEARTSATPTSYGENNITMASLQKDSQNRLALVIEALNANIGGRYLMGGNKTETQPVAEFSAIMDGVGAAAGFNQVVSERRRADLGGDTGDLLSDVGLPATTITGLKSDTVILSSKELSRFGYKLTSITGSTTGVKTAGPTTDPLAPAVQLASQPADLDDVTVTLKRGDGTIETVTLRAVAGVPDPTATPRQYHIGATTADTAAELQAALEDEAGNLDQYETISTTDADIKVVGQSDGSESLMIRFEGQPAPGETLTIGVKMPDGSTQDMRLRAVTGTPDPLANPPEYQIGATLKETTKNFQAALKATMGELDAPLKMGRLQASSAGAIVTLQEETPATVFGYKLASLSTTSDDITVNSVSGTPASMSVQFMGQPDSGESVTIGVTMPDGTSDTIKLQAVTKNPMVGQFVIGATPAETAANFEAALKLQVHNTSTTKLTAASTYAAADDFFNASGVPVKRVSGTPETATNLVDATPADTVQWYVGEATGDARRSATAQIDDSIKVGYGVRANETGMLELVRTLASMSVQEYPVEDATSKGRFSAMVERQMTALSAATASNAGSIEAVSMELGVVKSTIGKTTERHTAYSGQLDTMLTDVETVSMEETAMKLLALKTRLEASYQTTASISQLSLVNYIK